MIYSSSASASCPTDADNDDYGTTGTEPGCFIAVTDCDNADNGVNPGAFEDLADGVDQDCDGRDALARYFSAAAFSAATWPATGTVSYGTDGMIVGGAAVSQPSSATRSVAIPRFKGATGVMVDVSNLDGFDTCFVELDTTPWGAAFPTTTHTQLVDAVGTRWYPFPGLKPPHTLRAVRVKCDAYSGVVIDWIQVQNAQEVFPPPQDITLSWRDTRAPAGGYIETMVRDDRNRWLYMGTDVAGLARLDLSSGTPYGAWQVSNGSGWDSLLMQGAGSVADVLPMTDGGEQLYALLGDVIEKNDGTRKLLGGLWLSEDAGDTWTQLGSTWSDRIADGEGIPGAGTGDDVGGYGLETQCPGSRPGGVTWEPGGGRLLQGDDFNAMWGDVIYVANADEHAQGVSIYDGTDVCAMPNAGTALPAEPVAAILRVDALPEGDPVLLVGYRGRSNSDYGLWVCELPPWPLDCGMLAGTEPECWPVEGTEAVDVRDLELDLYSEALGTAEIFVADGGTRPVDTDADGVGETTCDHAASALHRLELDDTGSGMVATFEPDIVADTDLPMLAASSAWYITDSSMDPLGEYVYLNLPATAGTYYATDRMYRALASDLAVGAASWEAINSGETPPPAIPVEDFYEAIRAWQDSDLGGGLLEAEWQGRAAPFPARFAPGNGHSTAWLDNSALFSGGFAVVSGWMNAWLVYGLDLDWTDDELDSDGIAQPEGDTQWTFWPGIDPAGLSYQTSAAHEVAYDDHGDLWTAVGDLGILHLDASSPYAATGTGTEMDCLWNGWHAGGISVSVGIDQSVWVALFDEAITALDPYPHEIGVLRTTDRGATWGYAGAGWTDGSTESSSVKETTGERLCLDDDESHVATPFGMDPANPDPEDGTQFSTAHGTTGDSTLTTVPSLGNPGEVRAIDEHAALVLFNPVVDDDGVTQADGGLYLTVDGGASWDPVAFDGEHGTAGIDPCDETLSLMAGPFELVNPGADSFWSQDPVTEEVDWGLELVYRVDLGNDWDDYGVTDGQCSLARVSIQPDAGDPSGMLVTWDWIPLHHYTEAQYAANTCGVFSRVLTGATMAPWSGDIVIWGRYVRDFDGGTTITNRYGGACLLDPTTGAYTMLVNPADDEFAVGAVAPHPDVADLYAVLPLMDATTRTYCETYRDLAEPPCPDFPYPRLVSRVGNGPWVTTVMADHPPSLRPAHAAWSHLGIPDDQGGLGTGSWLAVATSGSGTWRGEVTW